MINRRWITGDVLRRWAPSGPTLLIVGVVGGVAWPALAEATRPFMAMTIFIFVLGTFLRMDVREFVEIAKTSRVSVALPVLAMIGCPLLMTFATWCLGIDTDLSFAMTLAVSAPPSSGTAAVARMLGLSATVPLTVTLVSMAIAPFTVPLISAWFGGISLNPMILAVRLMAPIGAAGLTAIVLRSCASRQLHRHRAGIDRIVVLGLLAFAVATMAGVRQQLELAPVTAFACVALAFCSNIVLQIIGVIITSGTRAQRLTSGLVLGNRNVGLVWAMLGSSISPRMALFFATTQFPIYILPRLLKVFLRPAYKDSILP